VTGDSSHQLAVYPLNCKTPAVVQSTRKVGIPGVSAKLWQVWIWVAGQEALGGLVVDERMSTSPLDGDQAAVR
jgi:hypothetical protein